MENYETAEGVSLPRSTLYNHYMRHCNEHKLDAVNAASFGKLIRSVFTGLRTRRLGTRGNSKYHYYGIRVKPGSNLAVTNNDDKPQASNAAQSHSNNQQHQPTTNNIGRPRKSASKAESYEACSQVTIFLLFFFLFFKSHSFVVRLSSFVFLILTFFFLNILKSFVVSWRR